MAGEFNTFIPEDSYEAEGETISEIQEIKNQPNNQNSEGHLTRRQLLSILGVTVGGAIISSIAPDWVTGSSAQAQTVPQPTPIPGSIPVPVVEVDPIEEIKSKIARANESLVAVRARLILPTIKNEGQETEEVDWEAVIKAFEYWNTSSYPVNNEVPSTVSIRATDLDVGYVVGSPREGFETVPQPIGLEYYKENLRFDWAKVYEENGETYYAATVNGEMNPLAYAGIMQIKAQSTDALMVHAASEVNEGYTLEEAKEYNQVYLATSATVEDMNTTREYEYLRGAEMSSLVTKLIQNNPELRDKYRYASTDGYVNPSLIYKNHYGRVINPPNDEIPYSYVSPVHNLMSLTSVLGNGNYSDYRGILGPEAGFDVVGIINMHSKYGTAKIIEDRLNMLEEGKEIPATFVNIPYLISMMTRGLTVRGEELVWHDIKFLRMLKQANIVAVWSFGNLKHRINSKVQGLDPENEEQVRLFLDTHIVATKGIVNYDNQLTIDLGKGLPEPTDTVLTDASVVAPGFFPGSGFISTHRSNPNIDLSTYAEPLSWFESGLIPVEQRVSGSSFASASTAGQLTALGMVLEKINNRPYTATEILNYFKNDLTSIGVPIFDDYENKLPIRVANNNLLIDMLRECTKSSEPAKSYMPSIKRASLQEQFLGYIISL